MIDTFSFSNAETRTAPAEGAALGFGTYFTDNMLLAQYDGGEGWHNWRIVPYGPLSLDPATTALHYGQTVFEGIKAFRGDDGKVRLFRPQKYFERLTVSARRLRMPAPDPEHLLQWIIELVARDEAWVPAGNGAALYIRPAIIASDAALGVRPSKSYLLFVILSPVDSYYGEPMTPVRIRVEEEYVRAVAGGAGAAKAGGNYAASLLAAESAHEAGFTQVLWLDGVEHRYLEEIGTMNVMLRIGDEVVTPDLAGSILAGVTRDSALMLMRDWGLRVSERHISIDEVVDAARAGSLYEVWGTGTAAGITPVSDLSYKGELFSINEGLAGAVTQRLHEALSDIQYARGQDGHAWTVEV